METVPRTIEERRHPTIRDVAREAGVGLGTVSRVINNSPLVSEATRLRVLEVIEQLNYHPNPSAQRLKRGKTLAIGVIVPFFTRPSFVERLRGIENTLAESEYDLIIYNVETPERRNELFLALPRPQRLDGLIVISLSPREDELEPLIHAGIPIVFVDANDLPEDRFHRVVSDDVAGARLATDHLIELGHSRIGYVSDPIDNPFNFTSSRDRLIGYRSALEAAGLQWRPEYHAQGEHGRFEARRLASEMLSLDESPTAIFAASDIQAMGVMQAAESAGLGVPDDLSVVGYDDIEVAEYLGLTTVRQSLFESGSRAVRLMLDALARPDLPPTAEVPPTELIRRKTAGPPRE